MPNSDWYQQALEGAVPYLRELRTVAGDTRRELAVMGELHRFYRDIGAPYARAYADHFPNR